MTAAQRLEQIFGATFEEQPDLESLRRFGANNAYCRDEQGRISGLCACENDWTSLSIPSADLPHLQYLNLGDNSSLQSLDFEGPLPKLRHLDLSDSALEVLRLPGGFDALEWLDISRNRLRQFIPLGEYKKLRHLDLSKNALRDFRTGNLQRFSALQRLYLKNNDPFYLSKKAAADKQGNCLSAMQDFQKSLDKTGAAENKEYKVLIVGNGGVGKSCLVERLIYDTFHESYLSTHGVALEQGVSLEQYDREESFPYVLNIWDFGGQDIYHATHRMFMQSSAVYLLLWDENTLENPSSTILENEVERRYQNFSLFYWLDYIRRQGGQNSVIVIKTKAKTNPKIGEHPDRANLIANFKDAFLTLDFHQVDSALPDWSENGFNRLLFFIKESLARLKRKEELPGSWAALRQHLRNLQHNKTRALSIEDYLDIASDYGEAAKAMDILHDWLVVSGVVFHRKGYFQDAVMLDQAWAMKAVYAIFNRTHKFNYYTVIENQKGQFSGADLADVWSDYTESERQLFIQFMLSCELCFEITEEQKDRRPDFKERRFLAPQLLPREAASATIKYFRKTYRDLLYIRYRHKLLHYGVIQSFIVRTQSLAKVDYIWREGILLEEEETGALIRAVGNEIQVEIPKAGLKLLVKIRKLLADIQGDQIEELVSLDGQSFVGLEKLRHRKAAYIEAENEALLKTGDLAVFLEDKTPHTAFDLPQRGVPAADAVRQVQKEQFLAKNHLARETPSKLEIDELPLTILFLAANPANTDEISWRDEHTFIAQKLEGFNRDNQYKLQPKDAVSLDDIIDAIEDFEPHILHFCGHGRGRKIGPDGGLRQKGGIIVHSEDKRGYEVLDAAVLERQFRALKSDFPQLKMVFFNACHSREQAEAVSRYGLYAIGTTDEIVSSAARLFAAGFYRRLAKTKDILAAIAAGVTRAIGKEADIESLIECYYEGRRIYPK